MSKYPLHDKMAASKVEHNTIVAFLDFLRHEAAVDVVLPLAKDWKSMSVGGDELGPIAEDHDLEPIRLHIGELTCSKVIAEYFEIDYDAFSAEKAEMYREVAAEARARLSPAPDEAEPSQST